MTDQSKQLRNAVARALWASDLFVCYMWDADKEAIADAAIEEIKKDSVIMPRDLYVELLRCWSLSVDDEYLDKVMDDITKICGYPPHSDRLTMVEGYENPGG